INCCRLSDDADLIYGLIWDELVSSCIEIGTLDTMGISMRNAVAQSRIQKFDQRIHYPYQYKETIDGRSTLAE
ncbi:hypothetical protein M8C21_017259, partial [Ambrosia artemisiifolia]